MKQMKKLVVVMVCAVFLLSSLSACGISADADNAGLSMADDVAAFAQAIDMDYAYDLAYKLGYDTELADNELGWRSAGSDAEHRTADYLVREMEAIGLTDVEKVGVPVDKFQFHDARLTVEGTDIDLMPAAYQCSGTDEDGITAQIIDAGTGTETDYAEIGDVTGKIVLVQVDQANVSWIDGYIRMADAQGAAAIITYANSGYGEVSEDSINVQDICCEDLLPTVAISYKQAEKIKETIEAENRMATLLVDVDFEKDAGISYNVVGKIKGKSSAQQIILASHYDKYWYGFQDNCCAVSLNMAVAKALIESGYQPENDIVIVAHGAEEWGASGSQFDWAIGSWGMMEAKPDWASKTICMLNTELPGYSMGLEELNIIAVPEYQALASKLIAKSGLVTTYGNVRLSTEVTDVSNMEDGVSYRHHGIPYMLNGGVGGTFGAERYHTQFDDADTYDEDAMKTNIHWYGAFSIYLDKMPAMELDMTATCDDLAENLNDEIAEAAGVDVKAYKASIAAFREAAEAHNAKIAALNDAYEEAMAAEDEAKIADLRAQGKALNQISLTAFKAIQNGFLKADDTDVYLGHLPTNRNIACLQGALAALDDEALWTEDGDGALDIIFNLNAYHDWSYYFFGQKVGYDTLTQYDENFVDNDNTYWGTDWLYPVVYVADTSYALYQADALGETPDYAGAKAVYQEALEQSYQDVVDYCAAEMQTMAEITEMLQ